MGRPRKKKPLKGLVREHPKPGVTILYYRSGHGPRYRINVGEDHPAFLDHYVAARAGVPLPAPVVEPAAPEKPKLERWPPGSLGELVDRYSKSAAFATLKPQGQRSRLGILESCCREKLKNDETKSFGTIPVGRITKDHIQGLIDRKAGLPGAANNRLKYLRILLTWADVTPDPTRKIKMLKPKRKNGWEQWSPAEIAAYEARHPVGTMARLAFDLALYTSARRSDIAKLGPGHVRMVDGAPWLGFQQGKTAGDVSMPMIKPLVDSIRAAYRPGTETFLSTSFRKPYTANGLGNAMHDWVAEAGITGKNGFGLHGLRKAAAARLAELGCSEPQIQAITGHATSDEVQRYIKAARRRVMASDAMAKLVEDWRRGQTKLLEGPPQT